MAQPTSWLSKALAVVVIVLIIVVIYVFQRATSKTDNETFSKGSDKYETTVTVAPNEYQLVRCGQLFDLDPAMLKPEKGKKK